MNRTIIKYIAIIAMTLDHIGAFFPINNSILYIILRTIGRITFPIMCYFIAQGAKHTSNKKKYALRILTLALISQIPWTLVHENTLLTFTFFYKLNTIFTLFLGLLNLFILNSNLKIYIKIPLFIIITISSFICDYELIGILYILAFYYLEKKHMLALLPIIYALSTIMGIFINNLDSFAIPIYIFTNLGLLLTIPLLSFYSNKKEKNNIVNKYSFYIYYPLHLLIIFIINML